MNIQEWCKHFRLHHLNLTLKQVSDKTGVNLKTVSAFEHGRSTNLKHLDIYLDCCSDKYLVDIYLTGLKHCLLGDDYEKFQ